MLHPQFQWQPEPPHLVGGFNPFGKYSSKWESSPNRGENKKCLKRPPSHIFIWPQPKCSVELTGSFFPRLLFWFRYWDVSLSSYKEDVHMICIVIYIYIQPPTNLISPHLETGIHRWIGDIHISKTLGAFCVSQNDMKGKNSAWWVNWTRPWSLDDIPPQGNSSSIQTWTLEDSPLLLKNVVSEVI